MSLFLSLKGEGIWNELDSRGKFPDYVYESTISSYKKLSSFLPWWKSSRAQDEEELSVSATEKVFLSDSDLEILPSTEESPSTSQATAGVSRYKRAKRALSRCSKKVKSEIRRLSGGRVVDKMAVKAFFKNKRIPEYKDKIEKCEMAENEWFSHYNLLACNAYDLESSIGVQAPVTWCLGCFKSMPERVPSKQRRLELLIKLCFVWYNSTLELKLQCHEKEEILNSFQHCRKGFDKLIVRCELEYDYKDVVNSFLDLIKAAFLNRICTDQNAEAANYIEEFFNKYKDFIHFPHVLIALYYYEAASMAYVKDDVVAFDHLEKAFHYLQSSSAAENLKWKYLLDIVYDLARYYSKVDSATKTKSKELCDRVFMVISRKRKDAILCANDVLLALAMCYLAIVLDKKSEAKKCLDQIIDGFKLHCSDFYIIPNNIGAGFVNTLVSFATAVYPHFAETDETKNIDATSNLLIFVYNCVQNETYGYKYIFNVTFLLSSIQYHRSDLGRNIMFADFVLDRINVANASPEILSYYLIATMLKGVFHYQQNKPDDGKELIAKASSDSFAEATLYHFASYNHRCFQDPSLLQEVVDSFLNDHMNIVEKAIVLLAGDQFREKFPSSDENKKVLVKIFSHFSRINF